MTDYTNVQESALTGNAPACKGKDLEHHGRPGVDEMARWPGRWRCPDCGDSGTFEASLRKLLDLEPLLCRLQEQMLDTDAVFLLPSDATPGEHGTCFGRPVYRVRGIDRPLIALGGRTLYVGSGKPTQATS